MYIARLLYPVEVLGWGKRIGIWFSGCPHRCIWCSNPELHALDPKCEISLDNLMQLIHGLMDKNKVDGFTITGGEPFYQPEALQALVGELSAICEDIIVYTGYTYMELMENNRAVNGAILSRIAVLIDGRYIEAQNHGAPLRGSDNQGIIFYKQQYWDSYYEYINGSAIGIQNFHTADGVISVGIHRPGFNAEIDAAVTRKGLEASND